MSLLLVFYVTALRAIDALSKKEPRRRRGKDRDLLLSRSGIDRKIMGGRSAYSASNSGFAC